jgi:microcystin-dependent protein
MLVYGDLIAAGLEELASDPTTGLFSGRMYRNTTTGEMKVYTGSIWKIVSDLDSVQAIANKAISNSTASDVDVRFPTAGATSKELQVPRLTTTERLALSSPTTGRVVFDTVLGSLFVYNGSAWTPAGGGATLKSTITATGHGFLPADLGSPLYLNGTTLTKARADAANTAEVVGLLDSIIDANTFTLAMAGEVTVNVSVSGLALVPGETYFLSPSAAGKITDVEPTAAGQVSKPVGVAKTTSVLQFINMRGSVVGGANARTQIPLLNAATSTVQNVSAYEAGELTGWVSIQATIPLKFYLAAQFSKNGAGTSYNISYQVSGDTPPVGFNVSITTVGVIQVTLPSVAGFGSASINFALNAPAVGVTMPLSIPSSQIVGSIPSSQIVGDTNPVGTLLDFAGTSAPSGWLMCDGRSLSVLSFNGLFSVIGYSYGGSGANFNIPDFRGRFARYMDNMGTSAGAAGRDSGRVLGTAQTDAIQGHFHNQSNSDLVMRGTIGGTNVQLFPSSVLPTSLGVGYTQQVQSPASDGSNGTPRTAAETRPINLSCNRIIKF